jgi:glycine/D-amino acid oxidase-like deaminating enzyme
VSTSGQSSGATADAIVVGGGVLGLATSYAIATRGARVVSVFPRARDGISASRAAGAMLGAFGEVTADDTERDQAELDFRVEAQRRYPGWLADLHERSATSVHQAHGTFIVANNDGVNDRACIRRMEREANRCGEPSEWVDLDDVPGLKANPHHAPALCLHLPNEHSVDADQLLTSLSAALATLGGWSHADDSVVAVRQAGDGWAVGTANGDTVTAAHVVIAAGSRSNDVLGPELKLEAGVPDLYFGKGVSCVVAGAPPITNTIRTPNRAFACGIHVVPRDRGRVYLGATNFLGVDHEVDAGVQPAELHNLFDEILHQINADIRYSRIEEIRVGYRPIASHRQPVIGVTQLPGLHFATGTYRNGMLMAPLAAELIASAITGAGAPASNPFGVVASPDAADFDRLGEIGIRDIVSFLHEPRGELPYDRAAELRRYVTALFQMATRDDERYAELRHRFRERLEEAPFNETMHLLFYEIVEEAQRQEGVPSIPESVAEAIREGRILTQAGSDTRP